MGKRVMTYDVWYYFPSLTGNSRLASMMPRINGPLLPRMTETSGP
jgi:hypothetical protein